MEEKKVDQIPNQPELPEEKLNEVSGGTQDRYGPADHYRPKQIETEDESSSNKRRPGY